MKKCSTGKIIYTSASLAEDALVDAWIRNDYKTGQGPVNIYQCDECGQFHFTSKGEMSVLLKEKLGDGSIMKSRRAFEFERRFRKR